MKTTAAKAVNVVQFLGWGEQMLADSLAWHKAKMPKASDEAFEGFKGGYAEGWRQAMVTLKFHGLIETEYEKA